MSCLFLCVAEYRILQFGLMSMSSEALDGDTTIKADQRADGELGLLNLLTDDTVFYVGGYPPSFKVSTQGDICHSQKKTKQGVQLINPVSFFCLAACSTRTAEL